MLFDIVLYYLGVGFVLNLILALMALYSDDSDSIEIDGMNFFLTIFSWPITLWSLISGMFEKE